MEKNIKRFMSLVIITILLMTTALGAPVTKNIEVVYNSVNITVNQEPVVTDNLLYDGTTYVPLRAISEMLGKEVGWDGSSNTASIDDKKIENLKDTKDNNLNEKNTEISTKKIKKTISVVYNSVNITVNQEPVVTDNLLYDGTTYVPLRDISEMLGKEVGWDGASNTASIDDKNTDSSDKNLPLLKIHYIDVGQGDSIFIDLPNGENILIDGASKSNEKVVLDYLEQEKIEKIDYLIATHPHEDHIGGLTSVINKYEIGKIYMPDVSHTSKTFENLLFAIKNKSYKINKALAGDILLDTEGLSLKILAPEKDYKDSNLNNHSVVLKLNYKDNSFIFTGDAESQSEKIMIENQYDLKSNVLKAGHHGSNTSTTDDFLNKVDPKYVVISCGLDNKYGHPNQDIMNKLKEKNIEVYRTDIDGTIVASSYGDKISFEKVNNKAIPTNPSIKLEDSKLSDSKEETLGAKIETEDPTEEVYVTKTGTSYHRGDCSSLRRSKIPISLEEARKTFEPCERCNPPN